MKDTIYLDPDLFMALGFSAEAHGGIGPGPLFDDAEKSDCPHCAHGMAMWLDGESNPFVSNPTGRLFYDAKLTGIDHDIRLENAGVPFGRRIGFERWCEIVRVDVAE